MQYCSKSDVEALYATAANMNAIVVDMAIEAMADWIEFRTGDRFVAENAATKTFDTDGKRLVLVQPRLRSVTSASYTDEDGTVTQLTEPWEYEWTHNQFILRTSHRRGFPIRKNGLSITGNWGWATTPTLIRLANAKLAVAFLTDEALKLEGAGSEQRERLGSYEVEYRQGGKGGGVGFEDRLSIDAVMEMYRLHKILGGRVSRRTLDDYPISPRDQDPGAYWV